MKSFASKSTTTKGKLISTEFARSVSICAGTGFCIYLVGSPEGLERHIQDKINLGFRDLSTHIIVERDLATYEALRVKLKELGHERYIHIEHDDFLDIVEHYIVCCEDDEFYPAMFVEHVDFDSIECYGQYTEQLIHMCVEADVENIHIINSTRNNVKTMQAYSKEMGFPNIKKWGNKRWIEGPLLSKDLLSFRLNGVEKIDEEYNLYIYPYKSIKNHNMCMLVLQRIHLEDSEDDDV